MDHLIGSLEVGKRADLVVLQMDPIDQIPLRSIYSALVYATKANDVCDLMVDGRVLLGDRQLTTLDEDLIREEGFLLRRQIIERLQLSV
jgi:5-methylthioadenosine/S-adenosylhomocysteine deaminase